MARSPGSSAGPKSASPKSVSRARSGKSKGATPDTVDAESVETPEVTPPDLTVATPSEVIAADLEAAQAAQTPAAFPATAATEPTTDDPTPDLSMAKTEPSVSLAPENFASAAGSETRPGADVSMPGGLDADPESFAATPSPASEPEVVMADTGRAEPALIDPLDAPGHPEPRADELQVTAPTPSVDPAPDSEPEPVLAPPATETTPGAAQVPPSAPPVAPPPAPPASGGGAMPLVLGGVFAAVLGAVATLIVLPNGWQGGADDGLEPRVSALESRAEVTSVTGPLETRIAALESAEPATVDLSPLDQRLAALEQAMPSTDSINAAVGSLTTRLAELEAAIDQRVAEGVATAIAEERAAVDARAEALDAQAETVEAQAARAEARTALAELIAAADSGAPAAEALSRLPDAPAALAPLGEGIAPLATLQADFAPAARAALAARPIATDASLGERVSAFFSNQTGARSLAPREGNDVDAVLSRAEDRLRAGDLPGTLVELDALDGEPAAAMMEWRARAEERLAVMQALDTVQTQLDGE